MDQVRFVYSTSGGGSIFLAGGRRDRGGGEVGPDPNRHQKIIFPLRRSAKIGGGGVRAMYGHTQIFFPPHLSHCTIQPCADTPVGGGEVGLYTIPVKGCIAAVGGGGISPFPLQIAPCHGLPLSPPAYRLSAPSSPSPFSCPAIRSFPSHIRNILFHTYSSLLPFHITPLPCPYLIAGSRGHFLEFCLI